MPSKVDALFVLYTESITLQEIQFAILQVYFFDTNSQEAEFPLVQDLYYVEALI
jgi:hypothetical protein